MSMNEIPIEKITQLLGEQYLENRLLSEELQRIAIRENELTEKVKELEIKLENAKVKK